jgi:putative membrane protein
MMTGTFSWHHLNQWHVALLPNLLIVGAFILYVFGVRRSAEWPLSRLIYFLLGLIVTFLATQSVIGYFDMSYFADHMVQHLLLIMVAAPLFAASAPLDLAHSSSTSLRRLLDSRASAVALHPLFAFALYFAFIPVTHLTGLFNLMLTYEWFHHLEQISFLVIGYLFFRGAFGLENGRTIHPGLRLVYVMVAVPVDTITGLALAMSSHNPFPRYSVMSPMGATNQSILDNIHLGGAVMWIGGDSLMLLACIPLAVSWVRYETRRTKEVDAELDRLGI